MASSNRRGPTALFGAALDTGNLGVGALATSVIEGFAQHASNPEILVFDNGWGHRTGSLQAGTQQLDYALAGARLSRRYYRSESLQTMYAMARLRGTLNPGIRSLQQAPAVLDVSGGDSFTDMYGPTRFRQIELPKLLAIRMKRPLILLPQTYGPFRSKDTTERATAAIRCAHQAWARDAESMDRLRNMLGPDFDPERHRQGVDMAFGLSPTPPPLDEHEDLRRWLDDDTTPIAGVNVSGLLWSKAPAGTTRDSLKVDYRMVMAELVSRLANSRTRVLLVPHVLGTLPGSESDELATAHLVKELNPDPNRVRIMPTATTTAAQAKWWISHCDWFVGARMHSTIAALSTGVPTTALAYSLKTGPVFATVNVEDQVIDARTVQTSDALDFLLAGWLARATTKETLAASIPRVKKQAEDQMATITSTVDALAAGHAL